MKLAGHYKNVKYSVFNIYEKKTLIVNIVKKCETPRCASTIYEMDAYQRKWTRL